ncbi:oxidoreductase [Rodentibacter pneumotropicus]|nr:oxidoreductase [Rodentibacter pneumotropicus]NBH74675.1 oxidoreductase [Rodentibacter pneumotropicus]OOF65039.1 aspartate-semialdehyde dehydrogenase [Rodentibacter pneumotropicus]THA00055.1 oxidoreductase [Rodentibacter pneumotropicus]THA06522.1 oxidoreductase [Rodentibacter pneumotropicus]THA11650.1 oxidoreductase [Rodentibacter pneumotropicus]
MDASLNIAIAAEFELCEKIAEALEESRFAIGKLSIVEIYPFDEEQGVRFNNKSVVQCSPEKVDWSEINYLFFAGDVEQLTSVAIAAESGCVIIDMKGICAALSDVPVVVPTINEGDLVELRQRNIVSLPDPQVSQLALAISPLLQTTNITQIFTTSLLPASYQNGETVNKLAGQTARLLNGIPLDEEEKRLAFDVYPQKTMALSAQFQKIFPQCNSVIFHVVQVPVFYGMAQKVTALWDYETDFQQQDNELIQYHDMNITPVINGEQESGETQVKLHINPLSAVENGIEFWTVADEQRFNLAHLSVKLLEAIYHQGY